MRTKKTGDRKTFVLSESNSSEEERDGGKQEADLLVMDEKETSVKKDKGSAAARKIGLCKDFNSCGCDDPECNEAPVSPITPSKQTKKVKLKRGITMDTGAHHNVMPRRMAGRRPIRPSPGSRAGLKYVGCGGEKMKNEGEVDIPFESLEGHKQSMIFQIAEINKPLGSVAYFVNRDYRVVFDQNSVTGKDLSYMVHKPTRTVYRFRRERNIWIMDAILDVADLYGDFSGPE